MSARGISAISNISNLYEANLARFFLVFTCASIEVLSSRQRLERILGGPR